MRNIKVMSIAVVYHSGAGGTRMVTRLYQRVLAERFACDLFEVGSGVVPGLYNYDAVLLGFPTYHCSPSSSMLEFIASLPWADKPIPAYCFTTCGLFSANAVRIFMKACRKKNIHVFGSTVYRTPATDGVLVFPPLGFMFKPEKDFVQKMLHSIDVIAAAVSNSKFPRYRKNFSLLSIINAPNKFFGKQFHPAIRTDESRCTGCGLCVRECIKSAISLVEGMPRHQRKHCEYCYKCIHHCPSQALRLTGDTGRRLIPGFYAALEESLYTGIRLAIK